MSLWKRMTLIFKAKANKALDAAEDPNETLDYSYDQQVKLLAQTRRGVADVATARKRLELQIEGVQKNIATLQDQARQAVAAGREDLAREALTRAQAAQNQLATLEPQHDGLQEREQQLVTTVQTLEQRVEAFRTQKETMKATYTAAKAESTVVEAVTGLSDQFGDAATAIQRAQDKTDQLTARASVLHELTASGALSDPLSNLAGGDDISRQLAQISSSSNIDAQLAALKGEIEAPKAPKAIEGKVL